MALRDTKWSVNAYERDSHQKTALFELEVFMGMNHPRRAGGGRHGAGGGGGGATEQRGGAGYRVAGVTAPCRRRTHVPHAAPALAPRSGRYGAAGDCRALAGMPPPANCVAVNTPMC